ncbi:Ankyrin-2 isoform 1 [Schistosoma japonicum]|uniref:Ankyrin-2 isoform 1 n=1 Tax=Schistosoma japonicum TaxID=6182 RepID=A0A4Z2CUD8_SCHJA|nr:Ankyrin-2 isoform 1 [Schistosoma japonicum]
MLRYYKYSSTGRWMNEYGNLYHEEVFNALYSYSPIHNVPNSSIINKLHYPAILILSDLQSSNVEYVHSLKLLATLQNELNNNNNNNNNTDSLPQSYIILGWLKNDSQNKKGHKCIKPRPVTLFLMGARYSKKRHKPRISKSQIPWLLRGAIRSNNVGTLQYLFSYPNGVDPSMVIDGMVKILIKAGADIYVADAPRYPLHQASLYGRADIAELLIRSGASVSALTERRQSCLHLLAHQTAQRYVETAKVLLKYHVNPNTVDDDGLAPLHRASVEIVEVLVAHETTDVNICSRDLDTPLLTAVKDRRELILIALIRADQQFREQHRKNDTTTTTTSEAQSNDGQCCRIITSALRTPSSKSSNSATSRLTLASATSTIFRSIISSNECTTTGPPRASSTASVNHHSIFNSNPSKPFADRHMLTSQFLRMKLNNKSADVQQDNELECESGGINLRSCMLRLSGKNHTGFLNAESSVVNDSSQPIVKSSYCGSSNLSHVTVVRKPENCQRCHSVGNPSDVARWWQNCDRVQRILGKTALTNNNNNTSQTTQIPLNHKNGQPSNSGLLRPRLDVDRPDKIGMTPLMIAAEAGSSGLNMAIALVNAGSNLALTDKVGMTALHHACYVGSLNMVRYLMERVQPILSCNNLSLATSTLNAKTSNLLNNGSNARLSCLLSTSMISSSNSPGLLCSNSSNSYMNTQLSVVSTQPPPSRLSNPELLNVQVCSVYLHMYAV